MEIQFGGQMLRDDFFKANRVAERINTKGSIFPLWALLAGSGGLLILGSIWQMVVDPSTFQLITLAVTIGILYIVLGIKIKKSAGEYWEKNEFLRTRYEGIISEEKIDIHIPTAHFHFLWSDIKSYGASEDVVVLFQHSGTGHIFCSRFFKNENDWLEFRKMLALKIPIQAAANVSGADRSRSFLTALLLLLGIAVMLIIYFINR